RFSPDGKEFLAVTELTSGFNDFRFVVAPVDGGKSREIFRGKNTAYVRYSPDGAYVAISVVPEKKDAKQDPLPELFLVPLKGGGSEKVVARNVSVLFRWFADSRRILVFEIARKDDSSRYSGNIGILDVTTGKMSPLAAAVVTQQFFLDLAPDNKRALFTALR